MTAFFQLIGKKKVTTVEMFEKVSCPFTPRCCVPHIDLCNQASKAFGDVLPDAVKQVICAAASDCVVWWRYR